MNNPVQPIFIMPEGTQRTSGRNAQRNNILAAKLVAETVRTTLGPKGMDKMLVDSLGNITVTNDGVTILEEMHIEHPAAKMIVEVAKTQESEVGDGTTTAVILSGELLVNAEELLDQKIHPTVIIKGYRMAAEEALSYLQKNAKKVTANDAELLEMIASTAMTGKGAEAEKKHLASLAVEAAKQVSSVVSKTIEVDIDAIKIETVVGAPIKESELIKGIVLDKEIISSSMPRKVERAKILLLECALEIKELENDAKVSISDPSQMKAFFDMEESLLEDMTSKIISSGATAVFCQKGVDDLAAYHLAKAGILVVRRVRKDDVEKLSKATGAGIISDIKDISKEVLGYAGVVREKKLGEDNLLLIEECASAKAVTILARASTKHVAQEVKRALTDAVGDLKATLENGHAVAGAGAVEMALSKEIHSYAQKLVGRERLAVEAFAKSLEVIPRTLAENAGLDPIDVLTDLKTAHAKNSSAGINVFTGEVMDSWSKGVVEPLRIKTQAISSATDVATMILRIDDVIASGDSNNSMSEGDQD